jgi:hypothetical protein
MYFVEVDMQEIKGEGYLLLENAITVATDIFNYQVACENDVPLVVCVVNTDTADSVLALHYFPQNR